MPVSHLIIWDSFIICVQNQVIIIMIGIHNSLQHVCPHVPAPSSIQPHVQGEGEREPLMPYTGGPPFCGHTQAVWRLLLARALVGGLFSVEPAQ
jgi:hypothetical protein